MNRKTIKKLFSFLIFAIAAGFGSAAVAINPPPLSDVPVPGPDVSEYVKSEEWAIKLGKALFWDMQVGSDGVQACATCHFQAGGDHRIKNQLNPGNDGVFGRTAGPFGGPGQGLEIGAGGCAGAPFTSNYELSEDQFPLHQLEFQPTKRDSSRKVKCDTNDVVGSAGVIAMNFTGLGPYGSDVDAGERTGDDIRQTTGRNTPVAINAVHKFRLFHDGRAMPFFNGQNPNGSADDVWVAKGTLTGMDEVRMELELSATASQSTGPPMSNVEMSWKGRRWADLGRKLINHGLLPLGKQKVDPNDSVLGELARTRSRWDRRRGPRQPLRGLQPNITYKYLIQQAFKDEFWQAGSSLNGTAGTVDRRNRSRPRGNSGSQENSQEYKVCVPKPGTTGTSPYSTSQDHQCPASYDAFTQMEYNMPFFWGVAIMLYERTLISDQAPVDLHVAGRKDLPEQERVGFGRFKSAAAACIICHSGALGSSATVDQLFNAKRSPGERPEGLVERMQMGDGRMAIYDKSFYNIGVSRTEWDLGIAGGGLPGGVPLAFSDMVIAGEFPPRFSTTGEAGTIDIDPVCGVVPGSGFLCDTSLGDEAPTATEGAFQTPTLRNLKFTGPYFHNGSYSTIRSVVEFYDRGGNFGLVQGQPRTTELAGHRPREVINRDLDADIVFLGLGRFLPGDLHDSLDVRQDLGGQPGDIDSMTAFLTNSLTDPRVEYQKGPFDHPGMCVPHGHNSAGGTIFAKVESTGAKGGLPLQTFEEMLQVSSSGGTNPSNRANTLQEAYGDPGKTDAENLMDCLNSF